jgi:uncharacterized iron-regulated protein
MKKRVFLLCVSLVFAMVFAMIAEGAGPGRKVLRIRDRRVISFAQMIVEVKKADLVFVGEIHDNSAHHRAEFDILRAFHESDTPMAVGLEMFRADSQGALNDWVQGRLSEKKFAAIYFDNWQMPWYWYEAILWYARDHELPIIGLNISSAIAKKVAQQGFSSLSGNERGQLPPGISCSVDRKYMEFIRKAYADHGLSDRKFINFCEAQMVWDKSMAWTLIDYRKKNPDKTVVVLAGVGHAWRRGIPEQVSSDSKLTSRIILPLIPGQTDRKHVTIEDADYVLLDE